MHAGPRNPPFDVAVCQLISNQRGVLKDVSGKPWTTALHRRMTKRVTDHDYPPDDTGVGRRRGVGMSWGASSSDAQGLRRLGRWCAPVRQRDATDAVSGSYTSR